MANYVSNLTVQVGDNSSATYNIRELFPHVGTCSTAAATAAKEVTIGNFKLYTGAWVVVKFNNTNSAAVASLTLNVDGTGAKPIKYRNANLGWAGQLISNRYTYFIYDGTNYQIVSDFNSDTYDRTSHQTRIYAGTIGVFNYSLCAMDNNQRMQSFTTTSGTGTAKTFNTSASFMYPPVIMYNDANSTYADGTAIANNVLYEQYPSVDLRYSCNVTSTAGFTQYKPVYLECTINSDGTFKLTTTGLTQTFTNGKYYILLGCMYNTSIYQLALFAQHPMFYYDGTHLNGIVYTAAEKTKLSGIANGATKVESSSNGKIKINGKDTTVYSHPTHTAKTSGLYKITVDSLGHVSAATAVAKSDITALGIPGQDTTYSAGNHLSLSGTTFKVADYCKNINGGDWNSATTNGWYMGYSVTNAPSTAWWFGRVVAHNNKYCMQEVWQFTASTDGHKVPHKMRMFVNNVWGNWVDVTVGTQVPENAVFTDTKVTSSANHYTPATASGQDKTTSASGATAAWSIDVVKGVTLNTDGKGHVTGISVTSGKIPANPNTDRYVNSAAFTDDSANKAASPVKMTLTRAGSDSATIVGNIPKVSSSSAGVAPKGAVVSTQSQSTKFLREDGSWAAPSYTSIPSNNVTGNAAWTAADRILVTNAASGNVIKQSAYTIGATLNSGTANQLAYYSGANAISATHDGTNTYNSLYFKTGTNAKSARQIILGIYGQTYGNDASTLISGTAGVFSYGDGGPQIDFNTSVSGPQAGALIFTDHDSAATGASWHFVSNQADWNVTSKRFHARTSISIGTATPNTSYNLYVNGTTNITGNTTIGGTLGVTGAITQNGNQVLHAGNYTSYALATTTKYAGSSSVGGAATSANKLNTNAGATDRPVYFSGGVPVQCDAPASGSWFKGVPLIGTNGVMEIGKYIDFHKSNDSTADYDYRMEITTTTMTLHATGSSNTLTIKSPGNTQLSFQTTSSGKAYTASGITCYPLGISGMTALFNFGGNMVIGGGEAAQTLYDNDYDTIKTTEHETLYLASDSAELHLITDAQTYANRKVLRIIGGQLTKSGGSWIAARDHAPVYSYKGGDGTSGAFFPAIFSKSKTGGWAIGTIGNDDNFYVSYTTDTHYSSYTNTSTYTIQFPHDSGTLALTSSNITGTSANVTGTVAIAHGGTGATDRLNALKALTNENVGTSAQYFLTITNSWGKGGYTSVADAKTVLGLGSAAYTASTDYLSSSTKYAASSSVGGPATSANILNKNNAAGATTTGVQYANGQPTVGTADGNAVEGSNASYKLWSYPAGGTAVGGGTANIQNLRLYWSSTYFRDIFISPNNYDIYHRSVAAGTAQPWRKILDSGNYTSYALPRNIKHIHTASGTEGSAGWVKIARITVTAAYANHPMTFTIAQRGLMQYRIHLVLVNNGSVAAAAISQFIIARDNSWTDTNNNPRAYIIKPSDGIFDLYIRKTEKYDHIFVVDFTKADGNEGDSYSVTWTNVHAADSEITGGTEAVKKLYLLTTTNYAGSSSAGGAATSANKLNTNAGGTYLPVYFSSGVPVAVTVKNNTSLGTIGWTSDAASNAALVTVNSIAYWNGAYSGTWSNLAYCNKGAFGTIVTKSTTDYSKVSISRNLTSGTKVGTITIDGTATDLYCQTNSDTKVRQSLTSTSSNRPLLMSYGTTSTTDANVDNVAYRNNSIYANPSAGTITANKFYGDITGDGLNAGIYDLLNTDNPIFNGAEWMLTSIPSSSGGTSTPSFRRVKTAKFADYVNSVSRNVLFNDSTNTSKSITLSTPPTDTQYLKLYFKSSGNSGQPSVDNSVYSIAEVPYMTGVNLGGILQVAQPSDNMGVLKLTALAFTIRITNNTLTLTKASYPSRLDGSTVANDTHLSANIIKVVAYR